MTAFDEMVPVGRQRALRPYSWPGCDRPGGESASIGRLGHVGVTSRMSHDRAPNPAADLSSSTTAAGSAPRHGTLDSRHTLVALPGASRSRRSPQALESAFPEATGRMA
jgi:hypothetical protein